MKTTAPRMPNGDRRARRLLSLPTWPCLNCGRPGARASHVVTQAPLVTLPSSQ